MPTPEEVRDAAIAKARATLDEAEHVAERAFLSAERVLDEAVDVEIAANAKAWTAYREATRKPRREHR